MDPLQPFGPRYLGMGVRPPGSESEAPPAWAALLRRNALSVASASAEAVEARADDVKLSRAADAARAKEAARAREAAEARERDHNKKASRQPKLPHPTPAPPRMRLGGWILSAPVSQQHSRQMQEEDLAEFSRWPEQSGESQADGRAGEDEFLQVYDDRREQLLEWLSRFGDGIVSLCERYGIRVVEGETPGYEASTRRVLVGRELEEDGFLLAFSRAYDEALGCGEPASRNSVAVLTHYQSWHSVHPEGTPQDFFCQALTRYLCGDPSLMPGYVEYLLRQSHGSELRRP